jgi:arginyl-tRNA synthetase
MEIKDDMKKEIEQIIKEALINLGVNQDFVFVVEHPDDISYGDYSTNIAMVCAKELKKKPHDFALDLKNEIEKNLPNDIEKIEIAGPGFINFYLSKNFFSEEIDKILEEGGDWGKNNILDGKKVMVEYTDPNLFKPFHIGHLMANAVGESISRIIEYSGADTIRANYQGDIGLHVAKAIYGLKEFGLPDGSKTVSEKAIYIGQCYSKASNLYDDNPLVRNEIDALNKKVYEHQEEIKDIYDWGRKITLEAFETIYRLLDTNFDYYFFESEVMARGLEVVDKNIGHIFEESEGAIVFEGQKYDQRLHTRVFVNSQGIPTYETKEIGITLTKFEKENLDLSIVTTAIEQAEYMKVVQKAISLIYPDIEKKMKHVTHGMMRLVSGKMASRMGNIVTGESLINDSISIVLEKIKDRNFSETERKDISEKVAVSALRYSILKSHLGADIIYDFDKSISFDGDSGPYLQYTAVRANSILEKSKTFDLAKRKNIRSDISLLEKTLYQFPEMVEKSYINLEPHHIVKYLTELASSFNVFYGQTKILVEENDCMEYDLKIVKSFYQTMKSGLYLLGIKIPEKM